MAVVIAANRTRNWWDSQRRRRRREDIAAIVGHLIDSASNNHQRFVRAQLKDDLVFEGYAQEGWVGVQRYNDEPWPQLVALWRLYNLHLAHVIAHAPEEMLKREHRLHTLHRIAFEVIEKEQPATLEYLMRDYVGHLKHHLRQIFTGPQCPQQALSLSEHVDAES